MARRKTGRYDEARSHLDPGDMQTQSTPLTLSEYAALDEPDESLVTELVCGVVVREPRPGRSHGRLQARIAGLLDAWARQVGAEVTTESGYILSDDPATVRGPDIAVVLAPGSPEDVPGGWVRGAPDVAVEVLSPSDTSTLMHRKTLDYLRAGARLVWIVDGASRTVTIYRPDGSARVLDGDGTLDGEGVLEGFSVALSDLFGAREGR